MRATDVNAGENCPLFKPLHSLHFHFGICRTGCTWTLTAQLNSSNLRQWQIHISGAHGRRLEPTVFLSRNPLIRLYLFNLVSVQRGVGSMPSYAGVLPHPPEHVTAAVKARCYISHTQASQLVRNARRQHHQRLQRRKQMGVKRGFIVDDPTVLDANDIRKMVSQVGMSCSV